MGGKAEACVGASPTRVEGGVTKASIPFEVLLREKSLSRTTAIRRSYSRSPALPQDLWAQKRWEGSAPARQEGKSETEKGGRKPAGSRFSHPQILESRPFSLVVRVNHGRTGLQRRPGKCPWLPILLGPSLKMGRFFSSGFRASQDEYYIMWVIP
jgi:hypothetical protein